MSTTIITGNTYPVRKSLYNLGGRWNAAQKGWEVPLDRAEEAMELVKNGLNDSGRYRSNFYVLNSGKELYRNKRGRCEDAPCCGCCNF